MEAKNLLFTNDPALGRVFCGRPGQIGIAFSVAALLGLVLPAWAMNLPSAEAGGFLGKFNWSLMYPVVIPLTLELTRWTCARMSDAVEKLMANKIITPTQADDPLDLATFVCMSQGRRSLLVFRLAAVTTIIVMVIDTWDLWLDFPSGSFRRAPDWDTAFVTWGSDFRIHWIPLKLQNFAFDLVAYTFQAAFVFLALYWVGKFLVFVKCVSDVLLDKVPQLQFRPLVRDPHCRLGLVPLGDIFDGLLCFILVIQVYAFYHRLQQHEINSKPQETKMEYVRRLWTAAKPAGEHSGKEASEGVPQMLKGVLVALGNPLEKDYSFKSLMLPSTLLPLTLITFPVFVVIMFPLGTFRKKLRSLKTSLYDSNLDNLRLAEAKGETDDVKIFRENLACLEKTNVWPNGDRRARMFFSLISIFVIGAWFPPLLVYLVVAGGLGWLWKLLTERGNSSTQPSGHPAPG